MDPIKKILFYRTADRIDPERGWNTHFRFHFFASGSGSLEVDKKPFALISPCILCLDENDRAIAKGDNFEIHSLFFHPKAVNPSFNFSVIRKDMDELNASQQLDIYWLLPFLDTTGPVFTGPGAAGRIHQVLLAMTRELTAQKGKFWPCRTRSCLFELLHLVCHLHTPEQGIELAPFFLDDPAVQTLVSHINGNFHRKISISGLSKEFAMNRTTLSEKFKKATGMTIMSYLAKIRVRMACLLLRDTFLPVSEILQRVGFEDPAHFGRVFRSQMNQTPSDYRKEWQETCGRYAPTSSFLEQS